jgi:hypothetical protein
VLPVGRRHFVNGLVCHDPGSPERDAVGYARMSTKDPVRVNVVAALVS